MYTVTVYETKQIRPVHVAPGTVVGSESLQEIKIERYTQNVEELNLDAVIKAVNKRKRVRTPKQKELPI